MITSTAKAEHAKITIKILIYEKLKDKKAEQICSAGFLMLDKELKESKIPLNHNWASLFIGIDDTEIWYGIDLKNIPSEATIDKYRLMAKNAVEAKYNELKNPFDEWSVKA